MKYKYTNNLDEIVEYLKNSKVLYIDTETTGLYPQIDRVRLMQIKSDNSDFAIVIDFFSIPFKPSIIAKFIKDKHLVFHNAKFDLGFLARELSYSILKSKFDDTYIMAKVFEYDKPSSLKALVKRHLNEDIDKEMQISNWSSSNLIEEQIEYAAADVIYLEKLFLKMKEIYKFEENPVYRLEKSVIPYIIKMEIDGIKIDKPKATSLYLEKKEKFENIYKEIVKTYNIENPQSSKQIGEVLEKLGIQIPKTDKGNYKTSEEILKHIKHPLTQKILELRRLKKEIEYLELYIRATDEYDRIHSSFSSWKTVSGRMSSENPNIQNVPTTEEFRSLFIADDGYVLVGGDFPQIELRIAAVYTKDKTMLEAIKNSIDLHKLIVSKATGKPYEKITKEERKLGKPVNFGSLYGMGYKTLRAYALNNYGVEMSMEEAKNFLKKYKETYKDIAKWHDKTIKKLKKEGKVVTETIIGRKAVAKRFTDALNYPIQGTGADMTKYAIIAFNKLVEKNNIDAKIVNVIHDEIIVEAKESEAEEAKILLKVAMEAAAQKMLGDLPCPVEVNIGKSWAEIKD